MEARGVATIPSPLFIFASHHPFPFNVLSYG